MTAKPSSVARLVLAALIVIPIAVVSISPASAAPTEEEVEQAKERLEVLERDLEVAIEQYNEAEYRLSLAESRLAEAKRLKEEAEAEAAEIRALLSERAVLAYTSMGSELDILLGAESVTELSDRLEFIGAVAQSDAELAVRADAAAQRAQWAAEEYADALAEARSYVSQMRSKRTDIEAMLDEQAALYEQVKEEYDEFQEYQAAQAAAAAAAAAAEAIAEANDGSNAPPSGGDTGGGGGFVPPVNATAAETAVQAAYSVLGTEYVWGSADPAVGFDCSGLTSWAWAQAGVYIPHSSQAQYATLPHVPLNQVQPGDLIFYYSPTSHVAIYVGGGTIIHARHPGPGGEVQTGSMYGYDTPYGAARPG